MASVDADTVNDATAFLETFFKLYPTATEKELAYYVSGNVIEPIAKTGEISIGIAKRRSFQDGSSESQASIPNVFQSEVID